MVPSDLGDKGWFIIFLKKDDEIPCDAVLLKTSDENGYDTPQDQRKDDR